VARGAAAAAVPILVGQWRLRVCVGCGMLEGERVGEEAVQSSHALAEVGAPVGGLCVCVVVCVYVYVYVCVHVCA